VLRGGRGRALGAFELFVRGRRSRGGVGRRVFGVLSAGRGGSGRRSLRRRRTPRLRRRGRRRLLRRRRTPSGRRAVRGRRRLWRRSAVRALRRSAVRALRRSAVRALRRRTDRGTERVEAFSGASLIARWLRRSERRRRRTPGSGRRSGSGRRLLVTAPLRRGCGLRRVVRLSWRRAPLLSWRLLGRRGGGRGRVVRLGRSWWARRCSAPRCCCSQRRAAGQTKLAGGLIGCATPRADDHESDSRESAAPQGGARGPAANEDAGACAGAAYPVSGQKARNRSELYRRRGRGCGLAVGPSGPFRLGRGRPCP
jgi:hypothetical protein